MHAELNYLGDQKLKNVPKCNQLIEKESFDFFMTVNSHLNLSIISYLFYGVLKSKTICGDCKKTFYNFQYFQYLSFSTFNYKDDRFNIYQGFKEFIKPQLMSAEDKCYCQNCKGLRDMKITNKIYSAPPYLIIHLDYGENKKYEPKEVCFGGLIDITGFVDESYKNPSINYKLIAVCSHIGKSEKSGNYITYCQTNEDKWYEFNDSSVTETKFDKLHSNSPYILIYKKI
jgi:ubiquitin C-terminal hydrolase